MRRRSIPTRIACATALIACQSLPAATQTAPQADTERQLKAIGNLYWTVDYALGANESCDIFTLGHYRALNLLRDLFRADLRKALPVEKVDAMRQAEQSARAWRGCLTRAKSPKQWAVIDNAAVIGAALIAAPSKMTVDPATCRVDGGPVVSRAAWPVAANAAIRKYRDTPRQTEFDQLRAEFARMIDTQCRKQNYSPLMQPGYEQILNSEDNYLFLQRNRPGKKQVFTSVGTSIVSDPMSATMGIWRSYRHGFRRYGKSVGINAFRVLNQGDVPVLMFHLNRPGMFSGGGRMLIARQGGWTARLQGNFDALELRLSDGGTIAMTKTKGEGSGNFSGSSEFTLSPDALRQLRGKRDDVTVTIAYRADGPAWRSFLEVGSGAPLQRVKLGDIRAALAWSNAPMIAKEDR